MSRNRSRHTRVVGWIRSVARRNFCHEVNGADAAGDKSAESDEFRLLSLLPEFPLDKWLSILLKIILHEVPESPILPSRFPVHAVCFYVGQFV